MSAPNWNITFEENSDFDLVLVYKNGCAVVDVTGYGARFAVRNNPDESALVVASVTGGQITIAGTTGQFTISIGATTINTLKNTLDPRKARYSFSIWPNALTDTINPKRLLEGKVDYTRDYGDS